VPGRGGADTNVVAFIFRGAIDGGRLVVESLGETPVKLRFAREVHDEHTLTWKNEISLGGGLGGLIETNVLPSRGNRLPPDTPRAPLQR
jgi:hypothetical protein